MYFQENAWAGNYVCTGWVEQTLRLIVKNLDRFVLFCDNLTAQVSEEFKTAASNMKGVAWFGLANGTDLSQPVEMQVW